MDKFFFFIIVFSLAYHQIMAGTEKRDDVNGHSVSIRQHIEQIYSNIITGNGYRLLDSVIRLPEDRDYKNGGQAPRLHEVVVFGKDNRDTATGNGYGTLLCYPQDGKEDEQAIQIGTATVLDVDAGTKGEVITTAEHVLKNITTGKVNTCYFFPDRDISRYMDNRIRVIQPVFGGYTETGNREHDWAVAIIERKVTTGMAGSHTLKFQADFDVNNVEKYLEQKHDFGILAYDLDYKDIAISIDCRVYPHTFSEFTRNLPMLYVTDCDAKSGSSGGALLYATPGGVKAIGIYIGSFFAPGLYPQNRYPEGPPNGIPFGKDKVVNVVIKYSENKRLLDAINSRTLLTR